MKKLNFFSVLLMAAVVFLFLAGCQKDESAFLKNEHDALYEQFLGLSSIQTKCQANNPNNPPVRLKQPDSTQQKRNVFLAEINRSGNFTLTKNFIEEYGNPVAELGLYFENSHIKKLIIPIIETKATKVTSFFEISQVTDRSVNYKFNNREYNDYYVDHREHKARPAQNRLNLYAYYYKLFDYAICETDNIPTLEDETDETPLCEQDVAVYIYGPCIFAITDGNAEFRGECLEWQSSEITTVEVPCPQGSGGGSGGSGDGGGPGNGPGGNGPGGNGPGGNGSTGGSGNAVLNAFLSDLDFISQWIDDDVINKLFDIINMSDKSEDCLSIIKTFTSTLRNNNYSQSAVQALNCIGSGLGVNIHPSAPDDCYFSMETSLPDIMSNFANFTPLIYGITIQNTPLAHLPCELANSQLSMTQITNLVKAIDNFLPDDQNQGLGVDGEPGSGLYPGLDVSYEWIADELVDLMTTYPQLNFDLADMEWLLYNYSQLQFVDNYLNSKTTASEKNLGIALSSAYAKFSREEGTQIYLGSGDPSNPIFNILSEMLFEAIKEQLIDIIPGLTFATVAPQFAANVQDGNWLEAMDNALTIVLNEGDAFFPAAKIASVSIGLYTSGKQIKRVFEAFDNIRINQFPTTMVTKIYNTLRNRLNLSILYLKNNFRWLGSGLGAKLDGVKAADFFSHIKDEYGVGPAVFTDNGYPVFKIDIPSSTSAIFMVTYPESSTNFAWTVQFTLGPKTSTSMPSGSKYKIRFDN